MDTLALAVVLLLIAGVAFAGSIRVGILLGRGIDSFVEARRPENQVADETAAQESGNDQDTSGGPTLE